MLREAERAREQADLAAGRIATGIDTKGKTARSAFHTLVGLLAWIGFVLLWIWSIEFNPWIDAGYVWTLVALVFIAFLVAGLIWVRWNRFLYWYRSSRNKETPVPVEPDFTADTLGRAIVAEPAQALRTESVITVDVDDDTATKRFTAGAPEAYQEPPPALRPLGPAPAVAAAVAGVTLAGAAGAAAATHAQATPAPEVTMPAPTPAPAPQPVVTPMPVVVASAPPATPVSAPAPAPVSAAAPTPGPAPMPTPVPAMAGVPGQVAPPTRAETVLRHFVAAVQAMLDEPADGAATPPPAPSPVYPVTGGTMEWTDADACEIHTDAPEGAQVEFRVSDAGSWSDPQPGRGARITREGETLVQFRVHEPQGPGAWYPEPGTPEATARLDRTAPSVPTLSRAMEGAEQVVGAEAHDAHSGVGTYEFSVSSDLGEHWSEPAAGAQLRLDAGVNHIVMARACDLAGNRSDWTRMLVPALADGSVG